MKIRQGFVSNSSSSNFILAFDRKPGSAEELQKMMFGDVEKWGDGDRYQISAPTEQIAEAVFEQLGKQLSLGEIFEEFRSGWLEDVHIDTYNNPNRPEFWIEGPNGKDIHNPEYERYEEANREKEVIRALEYFNNGSAQIIKFSFALVLLMKTENLGRFVSMVKFLKRFITSKSATTRIIIWPHSVI